jgi:hypothetical protein
MKILAVVVACMSVVRGVHAQTVRGMVTEQESGAPLGGAFVVLLDSAGVQRNATLTTENGAYVLRATHAGRFRIRAELIGHDTESSPWLTVTSSDAAVADLALRVAAIELEALSVAGTRRCVGRPDADGQTARLWEEARKALSLTRWTERERIARFQTRQFDRELRLGSLAVVWETVRSGSTAIRPYRAVAPDSLEKFGFVRRIAADSIQYYGPDAEVLLSDPFLDSHCFFVIRGTDEARGLAGLAFEPIKGRNVPDIEGTLWLDPKTSELKYIEYTYTGIPDVVNVRGVGGRTYFTRLPNGAWIVDRWFIRMPITRRDVRGKLVVSSLLEGGGEITDVRIPGSTTPSVTVSGTVYDSVRHAPLGNALVYLSGTAHSTRTDSAGRFMIPKVAAGDYRIALSHASFDSLPAFPQPIQIRIDAGGDAEIQMAVPAMATLIARICPGEPGRAALAGQVTQAGLAMADVTVSARYRHEGRMENATAVSDAVGNYVLCGLPMQGSIAVHADSEPPVQVRIPPVKFRRLNLEVK